MKSEGSSPHEKLMGSQEPSVRIAPEYIHTDGEDAVKILAAGRLFVDPWQEGILHDWMGRTEEEIWSATTCGLSVPRQNGKTLDTSGRIASGMVMYAEWIVYTAHLQKTATETFMELKGLFESRGLKKYVKETMRPEVLGGLGGFSGAFSLAKIKEMEEPVLLSGTDGCGTKVKLAMVMDKHDTIGIDAVAMCVNDIACAGGEPLFFLDYIACGKNYPEKIASIVKGVAEGCKQSDAALIGGETAEHPGLMPEDEYDLAGFAVGVCDKKEMITGENLKAGDVLIGMASSGVHSNGFSLVRKVFDITKESLDTYYEELGTTLGEALLAPTRIYVKALKSIKNAGVTVKACSHITGGGFYENIPRMLKDGTHAVVEKDSYPVPPIFAKLAKDGEIEEQMMYNTFNMGLGMILAVDPEDVEKTMDAIRAAGDAPYVVGKIEEGEKGVTLC